MNTNRLSVTFALIILNVVVFAVGLVVQRPALLGIAIPNSPENSSVMEIVGAYSFFTCFMKGQLWRLITYQFVHANFGHLLFNMWALYFFGPAAENVFGPRKFLAFYLCCGVAGAFFSTLLASCGLYVSLTEASQPLITLLADYAGYDGMVQPWQMMPMVGASAAIYGVMVAVAFLYPHVRISLLFPPVTLTMRAFAISVILLASAIVLFNGSNAGGEAGHLGGILMGAVLMLLWKWKNRCGGSYD